MKEVKEFRFDYPKRGVQVKVDEVHIRTISTLVYRKICKNKSIYLDENHKGKYMTDMEKNKNLTEAKKLKVDNQLLAKKQVLITAYPDSADEIKNSTISDLFKVMSRGLSDRSVKSRFMLKFSDGKSIYIEESFANAVQEAYCLSIEYKNI